MRIYEELVAKYIPPEYFGGRPNFVARLFNTPDVDIYWQNVRRVRLEIARVAHNDDPTLLVDFLVVQYGLDERKARKFLNQNVTREFHEGDAETKRRILQHGEEQMAKIMSQKPNHLRKDEDLEEKIDSRD